MIEAITRNQHRECKSALSGTVLGLRERNRTSGKFVCLYLGMLLDVRVHNERIVCTTAAKEGVGDTLFPSRRCRHGVRNTKEPVTIHILSIYGPNHV